MLIYLFPAFYILFAQMGGIDESAIDKLSSVCEFAKLIQSKSQGGCDLKRRDVSNMAWK